MWQVRELRFAADHPTAAGHFPGNPIIPGAVLLDEIVQAIAGSAAGDITIRSAKFLTPVRPGDALQLRWQDGPDAATRFECSLLDPERLALVGTVQVRRPHP